MKSWFLFIIFILIFFVNNLSAGKIYKSVDENGNLIFSDRPAQRGQIIDVQHVEIDKGPCFTLSPQGSKENLHLYGVNDCYGPIEVELTVDEAENIAWDRPKTFRTVISPRKSQKIIRLWQINERLGYKYTYSHSFVPGNPRAKHLPFKPYLLPLSAGRGFRISQAFHGSSTHNHPQSEYAVDIPMPEGTKIFAARTGVVMDVANDFFSGGRGKKCEEKANFIRILHDDGTMALYAHLKPETIQYPVGSRVEAGRFIAKSGNTGYSSGPHLHFVIQKNFGMELRSIPFQFEGPGGVAFTPEKGMLVFRRN